MSLSSSQKRLLRLSTADRRLLENLREGVNIEGSVGRTIRDLQDQVCADRLVLADHLIADGNRLRRTRPPMYRSSIGRFYYAMYQSARAVVYFYHDGDDHEAHQAVPKNIPTDFPNRAAWQNNLKDARTIRNSADYDPYPGADSEFMADSLQLSKSATDLVQLARNYLQGKGCGHV